MNEKFDLKHENVDDLNVVTEIDTGNNLKDIKLKDKSESVQLDNKSGYVENSNIIGNVQIDVLVESEQLKQHAKINDCDDVLNKTNDTSDQNVDNSLSKNVEPKNFVENVDINQGCENLKKSQNESNSNFICIDTLMNDANKELDSYNKKEAENEDVSGKCVNDNIQISFKKSKNYRQLLRKKKSKLRKIVDSKLNKLEKMKEIDCEKPPSFNSTIDVDNFIEVAKDNISLLNNVIKQESTLTVAIQSYDTEFELTGGFLRFKLCENNELDDKNSIKKLPENLAKKAVAAAILESVDDEDEKPMSKKQWKKLNRLTVGELKVKARDPNLVEPYDNCSPDPLFLLEMKRARNTVPVPVHWCHKGRYLQSKRGFWKPPFQLPKYIVDTGVMDLRPTNIDDHKSLKMKQKERMRPRTGCFDLDYEKLHSAFFKYQTKPDYTILGEIYYQGKELESRNKTQRPGHLSDILREALGIPAGKEGDRVPPPFLIHQQRYGPPPSWPRLKIPGLNAPLPPGASYGYHKDGWGKPPVDENNVPLYGNVFDSAFINFADRYKFEEQEEDDDGKLWGEFDTDDEEDSDAEDKEDGEEKKEDGELPDDDQPVISAPHVTARIAMPTVSTTTTTTTRSRVRSSSVAPSSEMYAPKTTELHKRSRAENLGPDDKAKEAKLKRQRQPYRILREKKAEVGDSVVGSQMVYEMDQDDVSRLIAGGEESSKSAVKRKPTNTSDAAAAVKAKKHKSFKF